MKKRGLLKIIPLAIFSCYSGISSAESEPPLNDPIAEELSLEALYALPIIDIATGYAVPLEKAPSVATIITAEDIEAMGALTLDEVLEAVPGMHVQPSGLSASNVFSIRGVYTSRNPQILILLNGYRVSSDISSGNFPASAVINTKNISRVEVVRGPGSAVYGADAYAGVINIVTKSAREIDGFSIGARGGSFQTKNIWGQYGGEIGNGWRLATNFEYMNQGADKSRTVNSDAQTALDDLFGTNASLTPSYLDRRYESTTYNVHLDNGHWKLGIDGWAQRNIGQGAGTAQALDHNGSADVDHILFSLEYKTKEWLEDLEFTGKLSYQHIDQQFYFDIFPAGNVSLIGSDGNLFTPPFNAVLFPDGLKGNPGRTSKIPQLDLTMLYSGYTGHTFRFNFGVKKEELEANESKNFGPGVIDGTEGSVDGTLTDVTGTPFIYLPDEQRTNKYVSIQDVWEISPDWTLTAGVRYDNYSDFGSTTNPRIALVWSASADLTAKLLYGRAFRAPSFSELYNQNNPVALGNPDLDPETIDTYELAFAYEAMHNLRTNLSLYYYKTEDMIERVDNADGTRVSENINSIKGQGVEIEVNWKVNKDWSILANYAYQKTINDETNKQQPFIPKQQLYLDARWKFMPDWQLAAQLNWVSDRKREEGDTRGDIDDYTLVNLSVRRKNIAKHWEIAASIKNLFDEDIREPSNGSIPDDYPMNERSAFIELSYNF